MSNTFHNDPYADMAKNTVSAKGQLAESDLVKFHFPEKGGVRVLFVGNSITLHGIRPEIGWHLACGMAASAPENDYVHLLERAVLAEDPDAAFGICQVADWERNYKVGSEKHPLYRSAREFAADIIVVRFIENCSKNEADEEAFKDEAVRLVRYLDKDHKAKVIASTGFWPHPFDEAMREVARRLNAPCVELGDLGRDNAMKAIGLFEHNGVAIHPGDLGMKRIAERLAVPLLPLVKQITGKA